MLAKKEKKTKSTRPPARPQVSPRCGGRARYLIGIDEAGRGALAGPVSVGAVMWRVEDWPRLKKELRDYPVGKDSKKLTSKQRDFWFAKIEDLSVRHLVAHTVTFSSNKIIDKKGINFAVQEGIKKCLSRTKDSPLGSSQGKSFELDSIVLLDGGLKAPENWPNQQTIIKGDEKELIISLASIVAKASRDREMIKLSKKYPGHHLDQHKGYGTSLHYEKIEEFGVLVIHRETYLRRIETS